MIRHLLPILLSLSLIITGCCGKNRCEDFSPSSLDIRFENNFKDDSTYVVLYGDSTFLDSLGIYLILPNEYIIQANYPPLPWFTIHTKNNTQIDTISNLQFNYFEEPVGCKKCPMQFDSPSASSYHDGSWSGYLNGVFFENKTVLRIP
tara:strand:- start:3026 stop:3469 length:444 start_codon:yes stop_codon:yes gene_type:complete